MKKTRTMLTCLLLMICSLSWAQTLQVTGKVTDAKDGQPMPGAYVVIKGGQGIISDVNGNFTITCNRDAILVVTFVGYQTQEVAVNGRSVINVSMTSSNILDEVVVTALGISREKKSVGAAIQSVNSGEITASGNLTLSSALSGKVAGMQISKAGGAIGAGSRIVVRGNSSLGSNEPLIVIDGIPISNDNYQQNYVNYGSGLYDINPEDIESVTVLKGGSAALYGMRAGNGVILITTKSGKKDIHESVSISYNGSYTFDRLYNLPHLQNLYGQGYEGSEYFLPKGKDYKTWVTTDLGFSELSSYWGADESWGPRMDIGLNIPQFDSPYDPATKTHTPTPWISHPNNIKNFFQTGYSQNHNISVLAKGDKSSTRASIALRDQKGVLPNTDQKRISTSLNTSMNINKILSFDLNMNYSRTQSDNLPSGGYRNANPMQSLLQWFGRQVDMKSLKDRYKEIDPFTGKPFSWCPAYHQNPYYTLYENTNEFQRNRFFGKTSLWIKPAKWLKFEGRVGYDYYNTYTKQVVRYHTDAPDGGFWQYGQNSAELNADIIGYLDRNFADNMFNVSAIFGANYRDLNTRNESTSVDGLTVPGLYTVSNASGTPGLSMGGVHIRSNSVYANLSLGYKSMVYVDLSARNDWSSTIKDPFFYPSVSASWIPTATFPMLKESFLNFLKIRGGWAKIGSATSAYQTDRYYSAISYNINGSGQFYNPTTYPPSSLKPESVVTAEVGVEANFFNNRLGFDIALYNKTTTDQILSAEVSSTTGYNSMLVNAGKIRNRGIEIQLNAVPIKTNDFSWKITVNWAKDRSTILDLYQDLTSYNIGGSWSVYTQARAPKKDDNGKIIEKYAWGSIYGNGAVREKDAQGKETGRIIVGNSGIAKRELRIIGNVTPKWIGGFNMDFTWKYLSAGFLIDLRMGGDIFSVSQMFGTYTGIYDYTAKNKIREKGVILGKDFMKHHKFVKSDGKENDIVVDPVTAFKSLYGNREFCTFDGSYAKLRDFYITYTLPAKYTKGSMVKSMSFSVIGSNMAILLLHSSNIARIDPESNISMGNSGVGFEQNSFMPTRSIGFKVGLTF